MALKNDQSGIGALKRAEHALTEEREFSRCLLESMADGVVACDADGILTLFNRSAREWHGLDPLRLPPDEWAQRFDLFRPDGITPLPTDEVPLARAFRGEIVRDAGMAIKAKGQPIRFILANGSVILDEAGQKLGAVVIMRDITEFRRLEQELRKANEDLEKRMEERTERMEDALFFVAQRGWLAGAENFFDALAQYLGKNLDMDYVVIDRIDENPEIAETVALYAKGAIVPNMRYAIKGTPCENVMGRRLCVYPQDVQQLFPEDRLLAEMGVESYIGIPLWDSSGQPVGLIALMNSKPLPDPASAAQLLQLVAVRAAAELARERSDRLLRTREHEFRTLATSLPDNIVRYDREGRTVYVNPVLGKTLGAVAADMIGKQVREIHLDGSYEAYAQALDATLASGENGEFELTLPIPSKEPIVHQIRMIAERDEHGEMTGVLAIGHDITERKRMEEELSQNFRYFESMDKVNRAIQAATDLEGMLGDVLDVVLAIFACDRAFLLYPCDPEAASWSVPVERCRPEYPGVLELGIEVPTSSDVAQTFRSLLEADGPVQFGPGTQHPLPVDASERFGFKNFMSMALRPRIGRPWQFGLHQCSRVRNWTAEEERLFREIARRLADGLDTMLIYRDLQESEQRYRLLFENSPISIWEEDFSGVKAVLDGLKQEGVTDIEAHFEQHPEIISQCAQLVKVVDVNEAALVLHGATSKEALLAGLIETFTAESFDTFRAELICLWNGANVMMRDTVVRTLTGDRRDVTVYLAVCPGYEKTLGKVIVSLADITERKRAVEEISKLAAIVESSDDAIFAKDLDGVILTWNRGAEQIYGYSAGEAIGRSVSMLIPPDYRDELMEIMAHIRQGEQIEHYTTERVCKDGKRISVSLTVSPLLDGAGNIAGASSIARDVSAQKEAEEVLRRSEERLRQAQRIARIGSWELNLAENILIWSEEIYRIFEIDPAQFGASYDAFLELIHPDDRATVNSAYTSSLKNRTPYTIEHRLLFPDGRVKHVREQCETYYDADNRPFRSVGTVQEITELKQAEDAILELNASLEKRVRERTFELQESQQALMNIVEDLNEKSVELEQANARLKEVDRLKSMFIASMSHELRTPLNSIIGFSSILHEEWVGPVNKEQKENLAIVLRSGKHLLNLINDVIDVSKIEAGKIDYVTEKFDLHDLIDEAISLIKKELDEKRLTLRVATASLQMHTDRRRLLQCLLNVLSNAMKFTEQGSVTVETRLVQGADELSDAGVAEISVTDTGIGIREEDLSKIFRPFVRLTSPLQSTVPGTGLGLYLSRKLAADVLKGDILLESEYGKGSRFTIKIPVRIS